MYYVLCIGSIEENKTEKTSLIGFTIGDQLVKGKWKKVRQFQICDISKNQEDLSEEY